MFQVTSFWGLLLNPWALVQYSHNMCGALITGAFVMSAVGAYYLLEDKFVEEARIFVRVGVMPESSPAALQIFPTGDLHGKLVAAHQPVTTAAMEALFNSEAGAPIVLLGQPDMENQTDRQSIDRQQSVELSDLRHAHGPSKGTKCISEERLAD